jgi:hypothetical protein
MRSGSATYWFLLYRYRFLEHEARLFPVKRCKKIFEISANR